MYQKQSVYIKSIKVITTLSDGKEVVNGFELTKRNITDPVYDVRDIMMNVFNRLREGAIDQITGALIRKYGLGKRHEKINL